MIALPQKGSVIKTSMTNGEFCFYFLYLTCPGLDYKSFLTPGQGNEAVSFVQTNFGWRFEPATPQTCSDHFAALLPSLTFTAFIIDTLMCYRMTLKNLFFSNIFLAIDVCAMLIIWQVYVQCYKWFRLL